MRATNRRLARRSGRLSVMGLIRLLRGRAIDPHSTRAKSAAFSAARGGVGSSSAKNPSENGTQLKDAQKPAAIRDAGTARLHPGRCRRFLRHTNGRTRIFCRV
jgi:hypothetical protein